MTRTQYFVASSLDGFIADSEGRLEWLFQFNDAEGSKAHYEDFLANIGALAMGAATYEFLLGEKLETWPYAGIPTWVFTHRNLPAFPGADVRFTSGDVSHLHREMVAAARGRNIWLMGGGNLVAQFAERGLLDEIWLTLVPVTLGKGAPLLPLSLRSPFLLHGTKQFGKGMVELRYHLTPAPLPLAAQAADRQQNTE